MSPADRVPSVTRPHWQRWRDAWRGALYGEQGFYRTEAPAAHFRTSVHASEQFAHAILQLIRRRRLAAITDYGAGSGELVRRLHELAPDLRLTAVDVRPRPADLPDAVSWVQELPEQVEGLLFANELLDNVPCDIVERDADGWRLVEVEVASGEQRLGDSAPDEDVAWVERWWPDAHVGDRVEAGLERDRFWAAACHRITNGTALAIDYGHLRDYRPTLSTLRSYRHGHETPVRLDGRHDVTAFVAIDAVAEAVGGHVDRQREMLRDLGMRAARPDISLAATDPIGYVHALSAASEAGELVASPGLGDLLWVISDHR
jgi:SAM-dependent MidA family methyltransferase